MTKKSVTNLTKYVYTYPYQMKSWSAFKKKDMQVSKMCKQLFTVHQNHPIRKSYFLDKNGILKKYLDAILMKYLEDNRQTFYQYIIPAAMIHVILTTSHNNSGHNGFRCTYNTVKRNYFWRGMKKDILKYCKQCTMCNLYKTQKYEFERKTFSPGVQLMGFISMDLIGNISLPSSQGHQ